VVKPGRTREILGASLAPARLQRVRLDVREIEFLVRENHQHLFNTKDTKDTKVKPWDPQTVFSFVSLVSFVSGQRSDQRISMVLWTRSQRDILAAFARLAFVAGDLLSCPSAGDKTLQ
jgi:predicted ATPase